jgi:hypothetical protein
MRPGHFRPLSPEELREVLSAVDVVEDQDRLVELADAILSPENGPVPSWSETQFVFDDNRTRETHRYAAGETDLVYDGEMQTLLTVDNISRQATVSRGAGGLKRITLRDLRTLPVRDVNFEEVQCTVLPDGRVSLSHQGTELTVDPATGFIYHQYTAFGPSAKEVLQYGPVKYADDIIFPTLTVSATYMNGVLNAIELFLVKDAEFNLELDEKAFQVSTPSDVVVVDMTAGPGEDVVAKRVESPVEDVVELVESGALSDIPMTREPAGRKWAIVLCWVLLSLAVVVFFFCWHGRFRKT